MKLFAVFLALTLYALTLVQCLSLPDPNVKCAMDCDMQENQYLCAADDKGTTKTYRNVCVMKTDNCLQNANFQKISDKECP
ncbi:uncharacterized protein LOC133836527 [Drosophila sulfurigaster albostrigata]|uniref:Uncharacterized protein LOC117576154 n=1 Tax=Drosophila albomicans TaxID=7291 RepID=A0A6P8XTE6_DROAB|nr:uncharacterized protein LOC117576154 [Drosophila albomicans]XP_060646747.1 uncharacterized protein LOC132784874 [Drosophila nasuta]XP_062123049.1 uncharacterized protein LOC133836527 [Drosophila sulfurigaster albostrigata]